MTKAQGTSVVAASTTTNDLVVKRLTRPHKNLLVLYALRSLAGTVFAPLVFLPLYFRYQTLRYRFDDDGVHASWGILMRREVSLTYARIQDIHLRRGLVERWLGMGTVSVQTASGSASAELQIEGVLFFDEVRDFLYAKMRGAREGKTATAAASGVPLDAAAVEVLREIRDELAGLRAAVAGVSDADERGPTAPGVGRA